MWSLPEAMRQEVVMFGCNSATGPSSFPPGAVGPRSLETSCSLDTAQGLVRKKMPYQSRAIGTLEYCKYTAVDPSLC